MLKIDNLKSKIILAMKELPSFDKFMQFVCDLALKEGLNEKESEQLKIYAEAYYNQHIFRFTSNENPIIVSDKQIDSNLSSISMFLMHDIDLKNRIIYLLEPVVNEFSCKAFIKNLLILDNLSPEGKSPIKILLNSVGGDVYYGYAMYDVMKMCKNPIYVYVLGQAYSMGSILLQAGTRRYISTNSRVMIHKGYNALPYAHPEINKRWAEQYQKEITILEDILYERIKEKKKGYKREKMNELILFDTILMPQEAIDLGLADEIFTSLN